MKGQKRTAEVFPLLLGPHDARVALLHYAFLETMEGKPLEPGAKGNICCLNSVFAHSDNNLANSMLPSGILKRDRVRNVLRSLVNVKISVGTGAEHSVLRAMSKCSTD